jgi:hypothetical protein
MINWLLCHLIGHKLSEGGAFRVVAEGYNYVKSKRYIKFRCFRCGCILEKDA